MDAANDNDGEKEWSGGEIPRYDAPDGLIESLLQPSAAERFVAEHIHHLYPRLLQGKLAALNECVQASTKQHQLSKADIATLNDVVDDILCEQDSFEHARYAGIKALMPYFSNDALQAQDYFSLCVLSSAAAERISLLMESPMGATAHESPADELMRMQDMRENAANLYKVMEQYGVGKHEASQFIDTFDTATIQAIEKLNGQSKGRG